MRHSHHKFLSHDLVIIDIRKPMWIYLKSYFLCFMLQGYKSEMIFMFVSQNIMIKTITMVFICCFNTLVFHFLFCCAWFHIYCQLALAMQLQYLMQKISFATLSNACLFLSSRVLIRNGLHCVTL